MKFFENFSKIKNFRAKKTRFRQYLMNFIYQQEDIYLKIPLILFLFSMFLLIEFSSYFSTKTLR